MDRPTQAEGVNGKAKANYKQEPEVELKTTAMNQHIHNHIVKNRNQGALKAPRS